MQVKSAYLLVQQQIVCYHMTEPKRHDLSSLTLEMMASRWIAVEFLPVGEVTTLMISDKATQVSNTYGEISYMGELVIDQPGLESAIRGPVPSYSCCFDIVRQDATCSKRDIRKR